MRTQSILPATAVSFIAVTGIFLCIITKTRNELSCLREATVRLQADIQLRTTKEKEMLSTLERISAEAKNREDELLQEKTRLQRLNEDAKSKLTETERKYHEAVENLASGDKAPKGEFHIEELVHIDSLWASLAKILRESGHEKEVIEFGTALHRLYSGGL